MSRDGAGTYNLPPGNPVVTESVISSTTHNTTMADVATALTQSISKDGQTTYTANQSMGGFKHTQVADATARNQYATAAQVQDGTLTLIGAVSGTDTITGTISPALSAYANGVFLTLIPVNNNTGPVTLSLNGLGAKPVLKFSSVPLVAGDLLVGVPATIVYNGTNFYLENPQVAATDVARLSQANNFTSNNTFSVLGSATAPSVKISSALPMTEMNNSGAPVDSKSWLNFVSVSGSWVLRADNDAHSSSFDVISASRTGIGSVNLSLTATNITLNGVNAADYPRLSQANTFATSQVVGNGSGAASVSVESNSSAVGSGLLVLNTTPVGSYSSRMVSFRRAGAAVANVDMTDTALDFNTGVFSVTLNGISLRNAALFNTGTLADARIATSNVKQHEGALALRSSQVTADTGTINSSIALSSGYAGGVFVVDNASTVTLTVGPNCFGGDGKAAVFIRRNTGAVTFSASGVTIRSPGGGTSITVQHGKAALIQMSSTDFELAGNV